MSEASSSSVSGFKLTMRMVLVALIAAVIAGGGAYLVGFIQKGAALKAQAGSHAVALASVNEELANVRQELAREQVHNQYMMARGWLYRSSAELDSRNFGTANSYVSRANAALSEVDPALIGVDSNAFGKVRSEISQLNVTVADDLEQQRAVLLSLANRLDRMLPQS